MSNTETGAERLIVALDVPEGGAALALTDRLAGMVSFFKVGYELFIAEGPPLVCPGIRPAGVGLDDHKRPATPYQTIVDGADYLVVGRPIRDAEDPAASAAAIAEDIERGLKARAGENV